jgi:hypothetical protein
MAPLSRRLVLALAATVLTAPAGCAGGDAATPPAGPPSAAPAVPTGSPPVTAGPRTTPRTAPPGTGPAWTSDPVTVVHHPAVPPVPLVTRVRAAAHPAEGYDRIVLDIRGELPGYRVRYVSEVRADPSDRPVDVPGRRHLLIVLSPAQAHTDAGAATVTGVHRLDLPMLRSWAVVGDFEGHVSIALGLDDEAGYRVGELPGRVYVDVAA